jgi:carbamoylphosphate synthase small subunit
VFLHPNGNSECCGVPMKKIFFIEHALNRMKERNITEELVKAALNHPYNVDSTNEKRKTAQILIDEKLLQVIYEEEDNAIIVISAYCTSKVSKYFW